MLTYTCNCGKTAPAKLPEPGKGDAYISLTRQEPPDGWLIAQTMHVCITACSKTCYAQAVAKAPATEHDLLQRALEAQT
jgi:hypothetical protein